jgi:hypothetical protein
MVRHGFGGDSITVIPPTRLAPQRSTRPQNKHDGGVDFQGLLV